jgi:hypothetical protein
MRAQLRRLLDAPGLSGECLEVASRCLHGQDGGSGRSGRSGQ